MGMLLSYLLVLIAGVVGVAVGLGRMLAIVGAALTGVAMFSAASGISSILQGLSVGLSSGTVFLISTAMSVLGLPVVAGILLRKLCTCIRLPSLLDRLLGAVLGVVAGHMGSQWLIG